MAILDDCVIIYEYNLKKLTSVSLVDQQATTLYSGDFVSDGTAGELDNVSGGNTAATAIPTDTLATPAPNATAGTTAGTATSATARPSATAKPGYTASGAMTVGATGEAVR